MPAFANAPCERVAIPEESQLPPLSEDAEAAAAQLRERGYWMNETTKYEGVITRVCRQRNEAVANIAAQRQLVREAE